MSAFKPEVFLAKLNTDDELNCKAFVEELFKVATREELTHFMEQLRRTCTAYQTERISFISDKSQEVTDAITILNQVPVHLTKTAGQFAELQQILNGVAESHVMLKSDHVNK